MSIIKNSHMQVAISIVRICISFLVLTIPFFLFSQNPGAKLHEQSEEERLISIALDTINVREVRRKAFYDLGKVGSDKAIKLLVRHFDVFLLADYDFESEVEHFPAALALTNNYSQDWNVIPLVLQELKVAEKADLEIMAAAAIVVSVVEKSEYLTNEAVRAMVQARLRLGSIYGATLAERRNLDRFLEYFN